MASGARDQTGACAEPTLKCALFATPYVAPDGTLWVVWASSDQIYVARSVDAGRTFTSPVAVTRGPAGLDTGADQRPQLVVDRRNRVLVSYATRDERFNGQVLVATSTDGGATFSAPRPITDSPASQRFITLALDASGDIFAAWIDKRNGAAALQAGSAFPGASLAYAWSSDGGQSFSPSRIAHDNLCECCRLGVAFVGAHRPVVLFRNIFSGERDHAVLTFEGETASGPAKRVSDDRWAINACPHHGPSLAVGIDGAYHAAWFSGGGARRGLFYARSADSGRTFTAPRSIGAAGRQPARPYVLAAGDRLWLAWKEFDGERSTVNVMLSRDGGISWDQPRAVASTASYSDHPLLIAREGAAFLSWLTRAEGYRVIALEPHS